MSSPERSDIAPYLNPEYWDGRMVGQPNPDVITRDLRLGQTRFADETVAAYLENHRVPYPLVTFKEGDVVDANDYEPGTIFYGNRESLLVNGSMDVSDFRTAQTEVLEHPSDIGFILETYDRSQESIQRGYARAHILEVDNMRYAATRSFIVVTRGNRRKNNLQTVNEHGLFRTPNGAIVHISAAPPLDNPMQVAQTSHTKIGTHELLQRINTLMLTSEARVSKSPSFADKLAQIGLNPFSQNT